jgi:hypothetical protein
MLIDLDTSINGPRSESDDDLCAGRVDGYTRRGTGSNQCPVVLRWTDRENKTAAHAVD